MAEDFDKENPNQTFMNGETEVVPWHESLKAFFEEYETPPNSPPEAHKMAQTLEDSPKAVLYTVNRPGQEFILSMEYPDHSEEVLMRGEEAKNLIAFWLDAGIIESMGRDHWGPTVLEYFTTPWSAKELGIPNKGVAIEEGVEDMDIGDFERPKARPFRIKFLLQQVLTQLQIDFGCPIPIERVHQRGQNEYRGDVGYGTLDQWLLYLYYHTSRTNKNDLYIHGNLIHRTEDEEINHHLSYYYNKKTETIRKQD